ncbi:MAG: radical SAM protein [Deltaproteobacteria bacterium]|nr:radical SAM protein [Deltaproteobacteria bacterium]
MSTEIAKPGAASNAPTAGQRDRGSTPYQLTRSVCPECLQFIDAQLLVRQGKLIMRKRCPDHGWFEALVSSDAQAHHAERRFNKPGTLPFHFERTHHGCPDSCGLCPEHQQHTCLGILEITQACDLSCPVCFAAAGGKGAHLPVDEIGKMLDRLKKCEGEPEVIQLSGGEPTRHPDIIEIVQLAKDKGFTKILLNTNGIRLHDDLKFLDRLAAVDPTIYLQFDGFDPATYRQLRGRDLAATKLRVVELLRERGMCTVLVATLVRGVNEHELGALVDFAVDQEFVRCLNLQPATYAGRFESSQKGLTRDALTRLTLPEVTELIAAQSRHGLRPDDFFPIPCPDPACSKVTYLYQGDDGLVPIVRLVDVEEHLDYIKDVSVPRLTDRVKQALESLSSMSAVPGEKTSRSFCEACGVDLDWGAIEKQITMISMMHFMDAENYDLARAQKCCVHEVLPYDGGIVPFCNYNVLHRGRG